MGHKSVIWWEFDSIISYQSKYQLIVFFAIQIALLISTAFLELTCVVYMSIPELQNSDFKYFKSYLLSLTVAFISLSWIYLHGMNHADLPPQSCIAEVSPLALVIFFSFLSASLWLNVIGYNICSSFRYNFVNYSFSLPNSPNSWNIYAIFADLSGMIFEMKNDILSTVFSMPGVFHQC